MSDTTTGKEAWTPKVGDVLAPKSALDVRWKVIGFRTIMPGVVDCFMGWPGRDYEICKLVDKVPEEFVLVETPHD